MSACASLFTWSHSYFYLWFILKLNWYNNKNIYLHTHKWLVISNQTKNIHILIQKKKAEIIEFHIHVDISYNV